MKCYEIIKCILNEFDIEYYRDFKIVKDEDVSIIYSFYIPHVKLAINVLDDDWLNNTYTKLKTKRDKMYYSQNIWEISTDLGINVMQFYKDEIMYKTYIVRSMILNKLGLNSVKIFARQLRIKEVKSKDICEFFENNHISGNVGSRYKLGLYSGSTLISAITVGVSRFRKDGSYELLRFATERNITCTGGFSKLLTNLFKMYPEIKSLYTFADLRFSKSETIYDKMFDRLEILKPNYYYTRSDMDHRFHRVSFQKHKLEKKLEVFDPNLTEVENCENNGWIQVYDAGNLKYIYNK